MSLSFYLRLQSSSKVSPICASEPFFHQSVCPSRRLFSAVIRPSRRPFFCRDASPPLSGGAALRACRVGVGGALQKNSAHGCALGRADPGQTDREADRQRQRSRAAEALTVRRHPSLTSMHNFSLVCMCVCALSLFCCCLLSESEHALRALPSSGVRRSARVQGLHEQRRAGVQRQVRRAALGAG